MKLQQHPLSAAWPAMSEAEFISLKDSIENIGVQMPIVIFEDQVIDGWNRYRAATDLGMDCPTVPFNEEIDPVDFVKAMNDARRHITGSQRAIAIVAIHAWKPVGKPKANVEPGSTLSQEAMAAEAGVSKKTIQQAQAAQKAGLADKVKSGEMSVKQAAQAANGKSAKPATKAKPEPVVEPEDDGPSAEELAAQADAEAADRALVATLLESDAPLAALAAENKQLKAEIAQLKQARDGYMNRCNEAIALVKSRDRQIAKLEQLVKAAA
jgi:hypothetical protein